MAFDKIVEEAGKRQLDEDNSALDDQDLKMGEGGNTSAHLSPRGYVIKNVDYRKVRADNPCKSAESPHDHIDRVSDVDRFPWAEIEDLESKDKKDKARVRMDPWYLSHEDAMELYHVSDVISKDLDMFFEMREEGITYDDFKPGNIGYFQDDKISDEGVPVAKAIDITDGPRKPWSEEEDLSYRRFSDIMDVYIRGTPDEDGLTDLYSVSVPEAEEHVLNYLGIESNNITGDPYKDLFKILDENQEEVDDILQY
jgi:hypothetical protein